jgi:hypothetical protein
MNDDYIPHPIDTEEVQLPEAMQPLVEKLAEHVHDRWALERLSQGWTYGPKRDDKNKKHPSLRAYGDLEESEKDLDRVSAIETLKAVIKLGWFIER